MDAAAANTVDTLVAAATAPAQIQAAVSTAVLGSTMDVAKELSAGLLAVMASPAVDPSLGRVVDAHA